LCAVRKKEILSGGGRRLTQLTHTQQPRKTSEWETYRIMY
jgi:hypothetical protein